MDHPFHLVTHAQFFPMGPTGKHHHLHCPCAAPTQAHQPGDQRVMWNQDSHPRINQENRDMGTPTLQWPDVSHWPGH